MQDALSLVFFRKNKIYRNVVPIVFFSSVQRSIVTIYVDSCESCYRSMKISISEEEDKNENSAST